MCGRFTYYYTWKQLHRLLGGLSPLEMLLNRYNVAPLQMAPVVRQGEDGTRNVAFLKWGLVPHWANDPSVASSLINARGETAATKPAFREAMARSRCVIPISGFYEWQKQPDGKTKQPYFIARVDREPFLLAGLWSLWKGDGQVIESFTVLTTSPNDLMAPLHDRMPVILEAAAADRWLDPATTDTGKLTDLLAPPLGRGYEAVPVSSRVNRVANDDPSLIQPVTPDAGLFD